MEYARIDSHRGQVTLRRRRLVGNDYCTHIVVIATTTVVVVVIVTAMIVIGVVKAIAIALTIAIALLAGIVRHVETVAT